MLICNHSRCNGWLRDASKWRIRRACRWIIYSQICARSESMLSTFFLLSIKNIAVNEQHRRYMEGWPRRIYSYSGSKLLVSHLKFPPILVPVAGKLTATNRGPFFRRFGICVFFCRCSAGSFPLCNDKYCPGSHPVERNIFKRCPVTHKQ